MASVVKDGQEYQISETELAEILMELYDDVLSGEAPCSMLHNLHRNTVDSIADGNPTIKSKFFDYATVKITAEIQRAITERNDNDLREAVEKMQCLGVYRANWPTD